MIIIKCMMLFLVLFVCSLIGQVLGRKYTLRVKELNEFNIALNIIGSKIKFTYEPLPEIFKEVSQMIDKNISNIFSNASKYMNENNAKDAWNMSINGLANNLTKEDLENIKSFGKMLGEIDKEGQINRLEMTQTLVEMQIKKAKDEEKKNSKMYKTLGTIVGFAVVIILI